MLIVLEGANGVGKSTQVDLLAEQLKRSGRETMYLQEPGGTEFGKKLRKILKSDECSLATTSEALLFAAARYELVSKIIRPALIADVDVILDRFISSSLVYQGVLGGLDLDFIRQINEPSLKLVKPNISLLLDMDTRKAFQRKADVLDKYEAADIYGRQREREAYLQIAKVDDSIHIIDGLGSLQEVQNRLQGVIARQRLEYSKNKCIR